jgi:DNA-directed RNA polymerase alpha subunit
MTDKAMHLFDKLAKPAQRALANEGIKTLDQLSQLTEAELMQLHGIGKNALQTIKTTMREHQIHFQDKSKPKQ